MFLKTIDSLWSFNISEILLVQEEESDMDRGTSVSKGRGKFDV